MANPLEEKSNASFDSVFRLISTELGDRLPYTTLTQLYIVLLKMLPTITPTQELVDELTILVQSAVGSNKIEPDSAANSNQVIENTQTATEAQTAVQALLTALRVHAKAGTLSAEALVLIAEESTRQFLSNKSLNNHFESQDDMMAVRSEVEKWLLNQNIQRFLTSTGKIVINVGALENALKPAVVIRNQTEVISWHIRELGIQRFKSDSIILQENEVLPKTQKTYIQYQDAISLLALLRVKDILHLKRA